MTSSPNRFLRAAQRVVLTTARGPLAPAWAKAYRLLARAVAAHLTRGESAPTVYARAGVGSSDFVPGLSDIDLAFVLAPDPDGAGRAAERVRLRFARLTRRLPPIGRVIDVPCTYDEVELRDVAGASYVTYGLDRGGWAAAYGNDPGLIDRRRILEKPGLGRELGDWRLLSGPERRPAPAGREGNDQLVGAWLELAFWWRFAFEASLDPSRRHAAYLCVKLVAEPARIWLWLAHGERPDTRREVLARTLEVLPEEADSVRLAADLLDRLERSPAPPLPDVLPALVRFSTRISQLVGARAAADGAREVRLLGAQSARLEPSRPLVGAAETPRAHPAGSIPLCDWRALAIPTHADESFTVGTGCPGDPAAVTQAAAARSPGTYRVLRSDGLLVFPTPTLERPLPRMAACPSSDPVSFALVAGRVTASFPEARGWSVRDTARRAVAEQRLRLTRSRHADSAGGQELVALLTAARAALLLEGCEADDPAIPVTVTATADLLGARSPAARVVVDEAVAALHSSAGDATTAATGSALRRLVEGLPTYAGAGV